MNLNLPLPPTTKTTHTSTHRVTSQVGFLFSGEDFERRGLADAVGADQAQHLARPRDGQPVQLERVLRVPVCRVLLQVTRQVQDVDGVEGAFLEANRKVERDSVIINGIDTAGMKLRWIALNSW